LNERAVVSVAPGEFQRVRFLVAVLHFAGHVGDENGGEYKRIFQCVLLELHGWTAMRVDEEMSGAMPQRHENISHPNQNEIIFAEILANCHNFIFFARNM
jgi:hypothetical protein